MDRPVIKLVFSAKRTLGSYLIRLATWSSWSHVSYLDDNDYVTESIGAHGVRRVTLNEALEDCHKFAIVSFRNCDRIQKEMFEGYLRSQLGKKYDFLALFGIALNRKWQDDDKWICSELIAYALKSVGISLFRSDEMIKITQQDLWELQADGSTHVYSL